VSTEDNKALVRRLVEQVINGGNLDLVDQLLANDYVYNAPGNPEVRGREGYKQLVNMYRTAFPDLRMSVDQQTAEGDMVITRWSATGTQRGDLMGMPPTGKQVKVVGITQNRVVGGRVAEEFEVYDALGMMQQLGAVPAPAQSSG
jgi:steroid delta-isomerase-like uncharacterized protein